MSGKIGIIFKSGKRDQYPITSFEYYTKTNELWLYNDGSSVQGKRPFIKIPIDQIEYWCLYTI